eukprot:scaffold1299_cov385-Pavlova_lutheri.AAC.13
MARGPRQLQQWPPNPLIIVRVHVPTTGFCKEWPCGAHKEVWCSAWYASVQESINHHLVPPVEYLDQEKVGHQENGEPCSFRTRARRERGLKPARTRCPWKWVCS